MSDGMYPYGAMPGAQMMPAVSPALQAAVPGVMPAVPGWEMVEAVPAAAYPMAPVGTTEWHMMMAEAKGREATAYRRMVMAHGTNAVETERLMREAMAMAEWHREMAARRPEAVPRFY